MLAAFLLLLAVPRLTPYDVLVVRGGSMEPAIPVGGILIIDRADRTPEIGEVMTFRDPSGVLVTHRIAKIEDGRISTQGDANTYVDAIVRDRTDVVGDVRLSVPYLGFVLYTLRQGPILLMLLAVTGGTLILGELRVIRRELAKLRTARSARGRPGDV